MESGRGSRSNNRSGFAISMESTLLDQQKDYINFVPPEHRYVQVEKYGSAFFTDNNEEGYVLQRAFQANNFTYLRNLPDNFSRNCILNERKERVQGQVADQSTRRMRSDAEIYKDKQDKLNEMKKTKIGTLGYFELFPYKESDYNIPKKLAQQEKIEKLKKRKQISDLEFRPVGFDTKMKYEDPFRYIDRLDSTTEVMNSKGEYIFPFHFANDAYDTFHQSAIRQKLVEEQLKLAGDFIPSKSMNCLNNKSKLKLSEILNQIQQYFKKFLKGKIGYFIGVNKRDHIEIIFEGKYDDDRKVQMVMAGILQHQLLSKYVLRKNLDRWGILNHDTGYLQFIVLPSWVKQQEKLQIKPTQTYQTR